MNETGWAWLQIAGGLAVLVGGGELLVRGAFKIGCCHAHITACDWIDRGGIRYEWPKSPEFAEISEQASADHDKCQLAGESSEQTTDLLKSVHLGSNICSVLVAAPPCLGLLDNLRETGNNRRSLLECSECGTVTAREHHRRHDGRTVQFGANSSAMLGRFKTPTPSSLPIRATQVKTVE